MPGFSKCPCLRAQAEEVHVLDYRHCSLDFLPSDVFTYERTLEELYVDANQIRDLPRELFYCHGLRKLCLSDNEIISIPPAIASLVNLQYLDISKNGIIDIPENIKQCKSLSVIEASVNPLGKLQEGTTQLLNLTELYLNDTFLDYMPGTFGRLTKLKILEVRENHLNTLPKSFSRLTQLERLDIGNNDFSEIPEVLGTLVSLLELWCDTNKISTLPPCLGQLKQLMYLDASKNRLESIPPELEGCVSLADLHLSTNLIRSLPESIGRLSNLTTFKVDDNRLASLPFSIGGLVSLSELNMSTNELEEIPPSIGLLRHLRTMYADENYFAEVPPELGSCSGLTVLSLRCNNLTYIPDELGRIPRLRVLNLSDNKLRSLPYSLTRLKEIQALWLAENQTKPLVRLQSDVDPDTGQRVLTCYLLPQQPREDREDMYSDNNSFHPSMWEEERLQRQQIKFDFGELDEQEMGRLERTPTPYPKEMKHRIQHMRNLALKEVQVENGNVKGRSPDQPRVEGRGSPRKSSHLSTEDLEVGLREASAAGLLRSTQGAALDSERHVLLRADKEKTMKDKARIKQHRSSQGEDSEWENKSTKSTESLSKGKDKSRSKSSSKQRLSREDFSADVNNPVQKNPSIPRSQTYPSSTTTNTGFPNHHGNKPPSRPRGSEQSIAITSDIAQYPEVPQTYTDFRRDLQSRSGVFPAATSDTNHVTRRPNSYHPQKQYRWSKGYESDTGYRSEGVQSEILYTKKHKSLPPVGRDGYTTDLEATQRHHHRQHQRTPGYSSDHNMMPSKQRPKSQHTVLPPQHMYNHYTANSAHNSAHSQAQARVHAKSLLTQPMPQPAYVPSTKRTTLRNDELYEPHKNKNKSRPTSGPPTKDAGSASPSGQASSGGRQAVPSVRGEGVTSSDKGTRVQGKRGGEKGAVQEVSEDEEWRAQLYQASVKLQKSPSDPHKQFHKRQTSPTKAPPTHSNDPSISSSTYRSTPPYPEAPPYSPPKQQASASLSSQPSPTPQSMETLPTGVYLAGHVTDVNTNRSRTDISQSVESMCEKRPHTSDLDTREQRPHTSELDTREQRPHTNELDTREQQRPHSSELDIREQQRPHSSELDMREQSTPNRKSQGHTSIHLTPLTNSPNPRRGGGGRYGGGYSSSPHVRMSNYEKDVAMFKGKEPLSQVSSSTDSGYVHGQISDRLSNDLKVTGSGYSPHTPGSKQPDHSRPPAQFNSPLNTSSPKPACRTEVTIEKKPGLGFSIAGGMGSPGNPYRPADMGIFITKVQADGPAAMTLQPGDKILQVNGVNFERIEHSEAVTTLRKTGSTVHMVTERY